MTSRYCLGLLLVLATGCKGEKSVETGRVPKSVLSTLRAANTNCIAAVGSANVFTQLETAFEYMEAVTGWQAGEVIQLTPDSTLILDHESLRYSDGATTFSFVREPIDAQNGVSTVRTTATIEGVATIVSDFSTHPLGDNNRIEVITFYSCKSENGQLSSERKPISSSRPVYHNSIQGSTNSQTTSFEVADNPSEENTYSAKYCLDGACSNVEITDNHRLEVLGSYGAQLNPDSLLPEWYLTTISLIDR